MGGRVIRAVPMTALDFSSLQGSAESGVRIAQHIDVSQFRYGTMVVRVHEASIPSGGNLKVQAFADGHTTEDPSKVFGDSTALGSVQMDNTDTAPFCETVELTAGKMGSLVTIVLSGKQGSQGSTVTGTFSVDLVLKD